MSRFLVQRISSFLNHLEQMLFRQGGQPPASALALAGMPNHFGVPNWNQSQDKWSLKALLGDGMLWAVPKYRRTIEKRLKRKFGTPEYVTKILKVKTNLRTCIQCGHTHEVGLLCPHCYEKVRIETEEMQEKIQAKLGLQPVEQEVIVLYEGEKNQQAKETLAGKRIVEMEKPRPMWFSRNLIQRTTQQPNAESKEVKPSDLG